jgi:hypothetical protein
MYALQGVPGARPKGLPRFPGQKLRHDGFSHSVTGIRTYEVFHWEMQSNDSCLFYTDNACLLRPKIHPRLRP